MKRGETWSTHGNDCLTSSDSVSNRYKLNVKFRECNTLLRRILGFARNSTHLFVSHKTKKFSQHTIHTNFRKYFGIDFRLSSSDIDCTDTKIYFLSWIKCQINIAIFFALIPPPFDFGNSNFKWSLSIYLRDFGFVCLGSIICEPIYINLIWWKHSSNPYQYADFDPI